MSTRRKNEDRLSSLPEELLSHILSLMPTNFAVRTCILSKRWRYKWTLVTNLCFDDENPDHGVKCYLKFVDRVLKRLKPSQLNSFRLGITWAWVPKSNVSKWINKAVRSSVRELDIEVMQIELPLSLFTCKTLTKLRLRLLSGMDDYDVLDVSPSVMLPSLKSLDILVLSRPSINVFKFIYGCPVLESLYLEIRWPDNEIYFNIPTLKRLELRTTFALSSKLILNVPNLESLFVNWWSCPHFVMENFPSSVEASVNYRSTINVSVNSELLKALSGVKSLSLLADQFTCSPLPKFPNLKHLELLNRFESHWMTVIQILESSPQLEQFSFKEVTGVFLSLLYVSQVILPHITFVSLSGLVIKLKPMYDSWIEPQSVPTCMVSNLKTMNITSFKGRKCDKQFLEFMLGNAEVLKTLRITVGRFPMKEEMEMCARLLKFPRASRLCEIHFVEH